MTEEDRSLHAYDGEGKLAGHLYHAALLYFERQDWVEFQRVVNDYPRIAKIRSVMTGRGLIHFAAETGHVKAISTLLDQGADPNMPEGRVVSEPHEPVSYQPGTVPLHQTVRAGHEEATLLLLARGALAATSDNFGFTPLHDALTPSIADALLRAGADPNALSDLRYFDEESLGWYYAGGPLHTAGQNLKVFHVLIRHGADAGLRADHVTKRTALHYAAATGNVPVLMALINVGVDIDAFCEVHSYVMSVCLTPLHYAAMNGHQEVVRALLDAGAEVNLLGGSPLGTALQLAERGGHSAIVSMLAQR